MKPQNKTEYSAGSSLIEVMVSALILSFSLLGIGAMQLNVLTGTVDSSYRGKASWIAHNLAESIRSNPEAALDDFYSNISSEANLCSSTPTNQCSDVNSGTISSASLCTPIQQARFDIWESKCGYDATKSSKDMNNLLREENTESSLTIVCTDSYVDDEYPCSYGSKIEISLSWKGNNGKSTTRNLALNMRL